MVVSELLFADIKHPQIELFGLSVATPVVEALCKRLDKRRQFKAFRPHELRLDRKRFLIIRNCLSVSPLNCGKRCRGSTT